MPDAARSRRLKPEQREAAILDAALEAFARHGFADARIEDIARVAQVSKGSVYLYFPTKQALFEALVRRDIGPRVAMARGFLDAYDGPLEIALQNLADMVSAIIDSGQTPIYPRLLVAESQRLPELVDFYRREVVGVLLAALSGLFARAMTKGEIAQDDPVMLAHLFVAPVLKALMWALVFTPTEPEPFRAGPYLAAHIRLFLKGLQHA
ncbi:MAG: TetR/AcrR family transcriptional regulator [Asticcacaulis sp.]|uniref:TetR/AcrR family transcriptional regulator n=1 Tax=Asticcacaulis sp. TaxID=1872648 RepID=UPI003F7C5C9A